MIRFAILSLVCLLVGVSGCAPSRANVLLRKENQQLKNKVAQLEKERSADFARIQALEGPATKPVIPQSRLERLFTAHGLSFGKLTGGYKDDDRSTDDTGVVVHVVPTDQEDQPLKSAGSFLISLFDLSTPDHALIGKRAFTLEEAKKSWYGQALLFNYVLKVPFQSRPATRDVLVHVEYTDDLTGRLITADRKVTVNP